MKKSFSIIIIFLKKYKFQVLLFLFSFIFEKKFYNIINSTLVEHLFSSVEKSTALLDALFSLSILLILALLIYFLCSNYHPSKILIAWVIVTSIIYLKFRFYDNSFDFLKLEKKYLTSIAYSDILLALCIAIIIFHIVRGLANCFTKAPKVNDPNGFYTDIPLTLLSKEDDIYDRWGFIEGLKNKILATDKTEKSFAIGVIGKWGDGKTTFLNTLEGLLKKEKKVIQLRFNPWMAGSPDKIIELFFSDLSNVLGEFDGNLKNQIVKYSKELISSIDESGLSIFKDFLGNGNDSLSLVEQNEAISTSIKNLKVRLVIYIDDVDRLDKNEALEVLRLIRNTADFKNTFFIVAFDKKYLIDCLRNADIGNCETYLDKIFQLEYYLPITINEKVCENLFFEEILQYLDANQKLVLENIKNPKFSPFMGDYEPSQKIGIYLKNIRDVKRFLNIFLLNFERIKHNIYLSDYIAINILRLKYPEVYFELYENKGKYLTSGSNNQYTTIMSEDKLIAPKSPLHRTQFKNTILYNELGNLNKYSLNEITKDESVKIIFDLFQNDERVKRSLNNHHLSIIYPNSFNRYFDFYMEGSLDQMGYDKAFKKSPDDFKKFILSKISLNIITDLQLSLENTKPNNKVEFETLANGIVYFANIIAHEERFNNYGYNELAFIKQLGGLKKNYNSVLSDIYENSIEDYKEFLINLFSTQNETNLFGINVLTQLINNINNDDKHNKFYSENLILSSEDAIDLCFNIYKQTLNKETSLNNLVWKIYLKNRELYSDKESEKLKNIDANFKNFIVEKDFVQFLIDMIRERRDSNSFNVDEFYEKLFETKEFFIQEIKKQSKKLNNKDICNEFLKFWEALESPFANEVVKAFQAKYLKKFDLNN